MKLALHFSRWIFITTCCCSFAVASPTANEFLPCHQMASSVLLHCLDEIPGSVDDKCWDAARRQNRACYAKVRESHRPGKDRARAVQAAQAEFITPSRSMDVKGQAEMRCAGMGNSNRQSRLCAVKLQSGLTEWRLSGAGKPAQIIGLTGSMAASLPDFEFDRDQEYVAVVTAEEGHPMLAVYDFHAWIKNRKQPDALFFVNPYPGSFDLTGWDNNAASAVQTSGNKGLRFSSDGPVLSTDDRRVVEFPLSAMLNYRVYLPEGRIERIK